MYVLTSGIGLAAFLYPFWTPAIRQVSITGMAHADDAPLMLSLLVGLCFVVLLLEMQEQAMNAKMVALLGILVAINAVLRFAEVAIPGPGGFSPIFPLIILAGYVFGARFGFLLGALTLLVSALITGSAGPWLPYQMFVAGWTGMAAPLCRAPVRLLCAERKRGEIVLLALFGGVWGLIYGVVMNIWFWPFIAGPAGQFWQPGIGVWETIQRYAAFYVVTSLVWDIMRLVGNAGLILAFGAPILRLLRRFERRFTFQYEPAAAGLPVGSIEDAPPIGGGL